MDFLTFLSVLNYGLVLFYGLFLSTSIAGGWETRQQKRLVFCLCPVFLLVQGLCYVIWGISATRQLYPLIVHLPLVLILVFVLKKRVHVALVSVCTAYLCCQLPRWIKLMAETFTQSPLLGEISYTLFIFPIFWLLYRYFVRIAVKAMAYSTQTLVLFGSLPIVYYVFDYATVIYSNVLYSGTPVLAEFFPTVLIIFYVMFFAAYHAQTQQRTQAELQSSMLELQLRQSGQALESLRREASQTAIYQHDMRHHLTAIDALLSSGNPQQAAEYIQKVQADVEAITVQRFCENELVNLLCSAFVNRAQRKGICLTVKAKLPSTLSIPDTELCSVISNGLENALCAVDGLEESQRTVSFYCEVKHNKLLIEVKNPYVGQILMRDGLPISHREGHGYGCRSIRSIAEGRRGLCMFEGENGVFTLRVVLPVA